VASDQLIDLVVMVGHAEHQLPGEPVEAGHGRRRRIGRVRLGVGFGLPADAVSLGLDVVGQVEVVEDRQATVVVRQARRATSPLTPRTSAWKRIFSARVRAARGILRVVSAARPIRTRGRCTTRSACPP
jgi:hypothetical protein